MNKASKLDAKLPSPTDTNFTDKWTNRRREVYNYITPNVSSQSNKSAYAFSNSNISNVAVNDTPYIPPLPVNTPNWNGIHTNKFFKSMSTWRGNIRYIK